MIALSVACLVLGVVALTVAAVLMMNGAHQVPQASSPAPAPPAPPAPVEFRPRPVPTPMVRVRYFRGAHLEHEESIPRTQRRVTRRRGAAVYQLTRVSADGAEADYQHAHDERTH